MTVKSDKKQTGLGLTDRLAALGVTFLSLCVVFAVFQAFSVRGMKPAIIEDVPTAQTLSLEEVSLVTPSFVVPVSEPVENVIQSEEYLVTKALASWRKSETVQDASVASLVFDGADYGAELDCLAKALYYEARGETRSGRLAVAQVVLNRVATRRYPNTVCGVVYQGSLGKGYGCQFSFTCDGSLQKTPRGAHWVEARRVAQFAMLGLGADITNDATHYHANYVNPNWASKLTRTVQIGSHIFYRTAG